MKANRPRRPSYGWPILLTIAAAAAVGVILAIEMDHRQTQTFSVMMVLLGWSLLVLVWVAFFSRLPMAVRLAILGSAALFVGLVHVRGVSGDLVPILEWRWAEESRMEAPAVAENDTSFWTATTNDYAQFLGPNRNAVLTDVGLVTDWSSRPPELVWKRPVGEAWSSFAIIGRRALLQEQRGPLEQVTCYDLLTGDMLWTHSDSTRYETTLGGIGPRATPTAVGDRVYAVGATGIFNCLDLATGTVVWSRNILDDFQAEAPMWGVGCSPLVLGDRVIVVPGGTDGGSLAAYDRATGEPAWSGEKAPAAYSSPQITALGGREQILIFAKQQLAGHDPETGDVLWQHPWEGTEFCISQPVPLGDDRLFASTGYGVGGRLFQVKETAGAAQTATLMWETPRLKAKFSNVIHRDGALYGLDDGVMTSIDTTDGSRRWKAGRYGHGQTLMVDDVMLVTTEDGEVVMLDVNPDAHVELDRFQAVEGRTWNHPALAAPYLIVRNDREAACYKLAVKAPGPSVPEKKEGERISVP